MADQAAKDAASKQRIITHMNNDHSESLSLYLQHFAQLSARTARDSKMTDISLETMTFRTSDGKTQTIPLSPPMTSYAEARTRSVEMDREAREALNISSIKVTRYLPPRKPLHIVTFAACSLMYVVFATKHMMVPGNWVHDNILPYWPFGGTRGYLWLVKTILWPVLAIHIAEAVHLDGWRLRKHGVERGTLLWWKWVSSIFVEGVGCRLRFEEEVERKTKEAEKAKH